jgi:hypothetical protein
MVNVLGHWRYSSASYTVFFFTCRAYNIPLLANVYLVLFFSVSAIILLQLVIAVLMDQFTQVQGFRV